MPSEFPSLSYHGSPGASQLLEVSLTTRPPFPEQARELVQATLLRFLACGLGGYSTREVTPASSRLLMTSDLRLSAISTWSCRLEATQVTPEAFQIFRLLVAKLLARDVRISQISITGVNQSDATIARMPVPSDATEDHAYPQRGKLAVPLKFEDIPCSKMRRVEVELVETVEAAQLDAIQAVAAPWFTLVNDGGFAMPLGHPLDVLSSVGTVQIFDDNTIEIVADRFVASEMAWNVLINMLVARQGKGYRLAGITVY